MAWQAIKIHSMVPFVDGIPDGLLCGAREIGPGEDKGEYADNYPLDNYPPDDEEEENTRRYQQPDPNRPTRKREWQPQRPPRNQGRP